MSRVSNKFCIWILWFLSVGVHLKSGLGSHNEIKDSMKSHNYFSHIFNVILQGFSEFLVHKRSKISLKSCAILMSLACHKKSYRESPHFVISQFVIPAISWSCFRPNFMILKKKIQKKNFFFGNFFFSNFFFFFLIFFVFNSYL